jgi:genome maintenance exonuclease 1
MFDHEKVDFGYEDLVVSNSPMGRFYTSPTGNSYPSITTVLGELSRDSIADWRARVGVEEANKISGRASRRGTAVHDILEKYVNNKVIPDDTLPHIKNSYLKLKPILDKRLTKVYGQEIALYSDMIELAGRVDLVGVWDGVPSIIDYKTSSKLKKKEWCEGYFMQCAFYAIAWEERTGMPTPNIVIVMDVDDHDPVVFVEHRDNWIDKLKSAKEFYYKRQRQRVI